MLTLTENASTIVRNITQQPEAPESAGLRITSDDATETFAVTASPTPQPGDQIVEQDGATVYLDQRAAELLDDKILDAAVDPEGRVEFALGPQS
jgi:Fe-S cluster assembly iron-binding protein IscA